MKREYTPVSCSLYDRLEALATLGQSIQLKYKDQNEIFEIRTKIIDLVTQQKEEFMITSEQLCVRLDDIIAIDDQVVNPGSC